MFSVDPLRVLMATHSGGSRAKLAWELYNQFPSQSLRRAAYTKRTAAKVRQWLDDPSTAPIERPRAKDKAVAESAEEESPDILSSTLTEIDEDQDPDWEAEILVTKDAQDNILKPENIKAQRKQIQTRYQLTRTLEDTLSLRPKPKQQLRQIRRQLRPYVAKPWTVSDQTLSELDTQLESIAATAQSTSPPSTDSSTPASVKQQKANDVASEQGSQQEQPQTHMDKLAQVSSQRWHLRPYVAPFACIPRYLEVNHTICSAVYLRHPVARFNRCEIPSPFTLETATLAFTWYLKRR